jgi:hypothetical protein
MTCGGAEGIRTPGLLVANSGHVGQRRPFKRGAWSTVEHVGPPWSRWLLYFAAVLRRCTTATSKVDPGRCEPLTSSMPWAGVVLSARGLRRSFPSLQGFIALLVATGRACLQTGVTYRQHHPHGRAAVRSQISPAVLNCPVACRCLPLAARCGSGLGLGRWPRRT